MVIWPTQALETYWCAASTGAGDSPWTGAEQPSKTASELKLERLTFDVFHEKCSNFIARNVQKTACDEDRLPRQARDKRKTNIEDEVDRVAQHRTLTRPPTRRIASW